MMEHTAGKSQDKIEENPLLFDSIMFRLVQIAENSEKLTTTFRDENKGLPWKSIKGLRNHIVHDYGIIDLGIIYDTVIHSIPELYRALKQLVNLK